MDESVSSRIRVLLINIHNQLCVQPTDLEDALITIECLRDLLEEVEDLYKD